MALIFRKRFRLLLTKKSCRHYNIIEIDYESSYTNREEPGNRS
jgi:hypothetical protein